MNILFEETLRKRRGGLGLYAMLMIPISIGVIGYFWQGSPWRGETIGLVSIGLWIVLTLMLIYTETESVTLLVSSSGIEIRRQHFFAKNETINISNITEVSTYSGDEYSPAWRVIEITLGDGRKVPLQTRRASELAHVLQELQQ